MQLSKLFLLLPFLLMGCSTIDEKPIQVSVDRIDTCAEAPNANSVVMRDITFVVVEDKFGIYWIGVSPKDYENMSKNTSSILEHIKKKNEIIKYYKECRKREIQKQ